MHILLEESRLSSISTFSSLQFLLLSSGLRMARARVIRMHTVEHSQGKLLLASFTLEQWYSGRMRSVVGHLKHSFTSKIS